MPSHGLLRAVQVQASNTNLDAVRYSDGRVYLALRNAPPDTVIHVVSSADERTWRLEKRITLRTDLRERRMLSLGAQCFSS